MNSQPLLITYYNTISPIISNYFSFSNSKLIISNNDMMGNECSQLLTNANNNLVYIYNAANIGCFIINSLISSDQKSSTYSINLYSIPLNLTNNILCVLSLNVPTYNITRTFMTKIDNNINNFTSPDNKKFIINTQSLSDNSLLDSYDQLSKNKIETQVDDTLFLYIIATNGSFNIIFNETTIHTVSNVKILPESNLLSIVFDGTVNPLKFTEGSSYTIYISTENSSTISNIVFNGTTIVPLNYSGIDLTKPSENPQILNGTSIDKSSIQSDTLEVTPVLLNQTLFSKKNNLNKESINEIQSNQSVILNIINPSYHNLSGYFSFGEINNSNNKSVDTNTIEKYTNSRFLNNIFLDFNQAIKTSYDSISNAMKIAKVNFSNNKLSSSNIIEKYTNPNLNNILTNFTNPNLNNILSNFNQTIKTSYDSISYGMKIAKVNIQPKTEPDNIYIPVLVGSPSILNVSFYDINNNKINFITPNSIIYLSSGLRTIIYSVSNSINNITNPDESTILSFNGEINSTGFPSADKSIPYVVSSIPITPFITYSIINDIPYNTPIKNGILTFISPGDKIIISNFDINSTNTIPFISLLYTIINTPNTLNILNLDYSLECSLIITGVALSQTQSTITYSIASGNLPNKTTNNYIITLLQSSDIINSVNNTKTYNDIFTKNNNLILGIQKSINNSYTNNLIDPNIQQGKRIIENAVSQSSIILTIPFINNNITLQIANSSIIMAFNAINYAMLGDPKSGELKYFYSVLIQLTNPIIVTSLLNNALYHVKTSINNNNKSTNLTLFTNAQDAINNAISIISVPSDLNTPILNTPSSIYIPSVTNALNAINTALVAVPDDINLLKAQSILLTIEPISSGKLEKMTDYSDSSSKSNSMPSTGKILCGLFLFIILIGIIAYLINSILSKSDEALFSSESSSNSSSSSDLSSLPNSSSS
jgi:hypothetical protein